MAGETNLQKMLATLSPELSAGEFVFCTFADAAYGDHDHLAPMASVRETEGLTLVVDRERAERDGLACSPPFRCITLKVHSSLDAVGLTAAFSRELTDHGISANVIAGYYHDHIFVQSARATDAMEVLEALAQRAAADCQGD